MEFKFNRYITTDGLPKGDMSRSEVIGRRHNTYHAFILYRQKEQIGNRQKSVYKLQIIHTRSGKEFWIEEDSDIVESILNLNKGFKEKAEMPRYDKVIDLLKKRCKEKYHMDGYFGFYMKKIKGRQFVTFKCKVCGQTYKKRKSYIRAMQKRGFKTSCCSAKCKFELLQYSHPSFAAITKGIMDWKNMKKMAEENHYTINDKYRNMYENAVKTLHYGRKGRSISEMMKKTGITYGSVRKIMIEANFKKGKFIQKRGFIYGER